MVSMLDDSDFDLIILLGVLVSEPVVVFLDAERIELMPEVLVERFSFWL